MYTERVRLAGLQFFFKLTLVWAVLNDATESHFSRRGHADESSPGATPAERSNLSLMSWQAFQQHNSHSADQVAIDELASLDRLLETSKEFTFSPIVTAPGIGEQLAQSVGKPGRLIESEMASQSTPRLSVTRMLQLLWPGRLDTDFTSVHPPLQAYRRPGGWTEPHEPANRREAETRLIAQVFSRLRAITQADVGLYNASQVDESSHQSLRTGLRQRWRRRRKQRYRNQARLSPAHRDSLKGLSDLDVLTRTGFRHWLARVMTTFTSCPVHYIWRDLGPEFWPRWVKWGRCLYTDRPAVSCSLPPGMTCQPARFVQVPLLRYICFGDWPRHKCRWYRYQTRGLVRCQCGGCRGSEEHVIRPTSSGFPSAPATSPSPVPVYAPKSQVKNILEMEKGEEEEEEEEGEEEEVENNDHPGRIWVENEYRNSANLALPNSQWAKMGHRLPSNKFLGMVYSGLTRSTGLNRTRPSLQPENS